MKKLIAALMAIAILLSLCACGKNSGSSASAGSSSKGTKPTATLEGKYTVLSNQSLLCNDINHNIYKLDGTQVTNYSYDTLDITVAPRNGNYFLVSYVDDIIHMGIITLDGEEVVPMEYAKIEVMEDWAIAYACSKTTEDKADETISYFVPNGEYGDFATTPVIIDRIDIYNLPSRSLKTSYPYNVYHGAETNYVYLKVWDNQGCYHFLSPDSMPEIGLAEYEAAHKPGDYFVYTGTHGISKVYGLGGTNDEKITEPIYKAMILGEDDLIIVNEFQECDYLIDYTGKTVLEPQYKIYTVTYRTDTVNDNHRAHIAPQGVVAYQSEKDKTVVLWNRNTGAKNEIDITGSTNCNFYGSFFLVNKGGNYECYDLDGKRINIPSNMTGITGIAYPFGSFLLATNAKSEKEEECLLNEKGEILFQNIIETNITADGHIVTRDYKDGQFVSVSVFSLIK